MRFTDLIGISLRNLWRRKLRSLLTILGVVIGTTSVLLMLSIGFGQRRSFLEAVNREGGLTNIEIHSNVGYNPDGTKYGNPDEKALTDEIVKQIEDLPQIKEVVPYLSIDCLFKQGKLEMWSNINGVPRAYLDRIDLPIVQGKKSSDFLALYVGYDRLFNFSDPNARHDYFDWEAIREAGPQVDLINEDFFVIWDVQALYASQDPASGVSKPKRYPMRAAAIIGTDKQEQWSPYNYEVFVPLEDLKEELHRVFKGKAWPGQPRRKNGKHTGEIVYNKLVAISHSYDQTKDALFAIKELGLQGNSPVEYIEAMEKESKRSQMILGAIGGVSLIVAAIGIANTMMMSIYERTKEIGVFKVLGCSLHNIRNLFLAEAGFIGFFGGIIGISFSLLGSFFLNRYGGALIAGGRGMMGGESTTISYIPLWLIPLALFFAIMIGMLSGLMPARRAMRLSALEALRNE